MFGALVKLVGMDYSFEALKTEKAMAMRRYRRARKVAVAFRALEACLALFLLSWLSSRLPSAAHSLRHLYSLLLSPRFVFLFGNAIILTLFAKSGHFSPKPSSDVYDESLKNSDAPRADNKPSARVTDSKSAPKRASADANPARRELGRSRSVGVEPAKKQELRRTETDVGRGAVAEEEEESPEVEMSSEEFRRTIEAFIEKELRFRRQESMAIV